MARHIALLAGEGRLVDNVRAAAEKKGDRVSQFTLWPFVRTPKSVHQKIEVGAFLDTLEANLGASGATHLLAAGSVVVSAAERRAVGAWLKLAAPGELSDDNAPRITEVLAGRSGLCILGAHEILPEALAPSGTLTGALNPVHRPLVRAALVAARNSGGLDFGQAVVCSGGRPIAAEGVEGTDGLIARVGEYVRAGLAGGEGSLLVLAKALRPAQPRHFDMPTVGPDTVRACAGAGIDVIALEAGSCLMVDREKMLSLAEQLGVGIVGMNIDG